ncbi:MAG: hypothetical protein U0353_35515 [Sandaracinus sp.]
MSDERESERGSDEKHRAGHEKLLEASPKHRAGHEKPGDAGEPDASQSELAQVNPVRSMAAVSLTFLLFTQILSRVGATTLSVLLPGAFPAQPDEEHVVVPGTVGLVAMLLMTAFNATLAGLLAGRIGRVMRLWHGVVLGAILGMFAAISMEGLREFPGWFALGYLFLPPLGASFGGYLATRVQPPAARRIVSETVASRPPPTRGHGDDS